MATILFMGALNPLAGGREKNINLDTIATINDLIKFLANDAPELGQALNRPTTLVVVNKTVCDRGQSISEGDEIAFLPPMSGG